ncbi:hypothetical protein C8J57DRAFT_220105 [Mycena rebaudengoi]|nr:hypothetical protein C8J57DRAFT_220105 [Mycena rebaudengoi]
MAQRAPAPTYSARGSGLSEGRTPPSLRLRRPSKSEDTGRDVAQRCIREARRCVMSFSLLVLLSDAYSIIFSSVSNPDDFHDPTLSLRMFHTDTFMKIWTFSCVELLVYVCLIFLLSSCLP